MNTEQRVLAALDRKPVDRAPVFIYLNPYTDNWASRDPSYASLLAATRQYADVIYDWYFPAGHFCTAAELSRETRDIGSGVTESVIHTPRGPVTLQTAPDWRGGGTLKHWIATEEDARRILSIPDVPPRPDLTPFLHERRRLSDCAIAQATFPDPVCMLGGLIQPETLAVWTLEARDLLREMLRAAFERIRGMLKYCLERGVGPLYYFNGPEYALPPLMSPRDFDEFVVDFDKPLGDLVHSFPGNRVIIHSHGRVNAFLERFAAIGTDGLNVLEPPPLGDTLLAEAKRRVGNRLCLIGNIQYDDIVRGTPEAVDRLVREAIRDGAPGGGFILSPCASPYESPLPPKASDNLTLYLVKAREYGVRACI